MLNELKNLIAVFFDYFPIGYGLDAPVAAKDVQGILRKNTGGTKQESRQDSHPAMLPNRLACLL
jgi:hypothetical protein